jgi:hypothetical protein
MPYGLQSNIEQSHLCEIKIPLRPMQDRSPPAKALRAHEKRSTAALLKHFPHTAGRLCEMLLRRERSDDCFKARIAA